MRLTTTIRRTLPSQPAFDAVRSQCQEIWAKFSIERAEARRRSTDEERRQISTISNWMKCLKTMIWHVHFTRTSADVTIHDVNDPGLAAGIGGEDLLRIRTGRLSGNFKSLWCTFKYGDALLTEEIGDLFAVHDFPISFGGISARCYPVLLRDLALKHIDILSKNSNRHPIVPSCKSDVFGENWWIMINDRSEEWFTPEAVVRINEELDAIEDFNFGAACADDAPSRRDGATIRGATMASDLRLFISHSAKDAVIAEALIELLRDALGLPAEAIRCTSVDGYRLPGGADTDEQLRSETHSADAFIGLISPNSLASLYVAFELGARWGAGKYLVPVLAPGVSVSVMDGPLIGLNALRLDNASQLHQLIQELAAELGVPATSPATYQRYINRILTLPVHLTDQTQSHSKVRAIAFSTFVSEVKVFPSETNKLQHISTYLESLQDRIPLADLVPFLRQFSSESNRLKATELLLLRLAVPSEEEEKGFLTLFTSESNRHEAFALIRRVQH